MAGIDAFGTQLYIGDGASSFDAVAEVTSVDFLDIEADDLDVTSHDSTGQWREYIGGLKDGGEVSFEINFDPDLHGSFIALVGTTRDMKIKLSDTGATLVTFDGYLKSLSGTAPHDDKLSASATIKVSGPVTISPT